MTTKIIGLPDGGAGIIFPNHPAHHNADGTIQVTWSAETLRAMVEVAQEAVAADDLIKVERPDTCECGHPATDHQTGEGPATGWCFAYRGEQGTCDCEAFS